MHCVWKFSVVSLETPDQFQTNLRDTKASTALMAGLDSTLGARSAVLWMLSAEEQLYSHFPTTT